MHNILFMGRKPVAAQALSWLCNRNDVNVVGVITDSHLSVSPTKDVAVKQGLRVMSREEAEELLLTGKMEIDLAFSVLYWQKIRDPVLEAARKGVINFHPAPLPDYKGTAGYNLAILENLKDWAVSAHYVDVNIDTGALIEVRRFPIDTQNETALTLERKSQPQLFEQFKRVAESAMAMNSYLPTEPNIGGRYVSRAEMEAMKEVLPEDDIERKIRAFWFPPYDGAYLWVNGVKCTLVHQPVLQLLAAPGDSNLFTHAAQGCRDECKRN